MSTSPQDPRATKAPRRWRYLIRGLKAILALVDSPKTPVRLPLGSDTVARIKGKNQAVEAELRDWLDVALSTNHDDVK